MSSLETTVAENMVAVIANEIGDGDVVLEGIGTFLPTSAYMLAQATHARGVLRLCPVGNVFVAQAHALSLADYEFETLRRGLARFTYWDVNGSYLPAYLPGQKGKWREFLRPAQVDSRGRSNNVVIGPYDKPVVRLPGAAGLPDGVPVESAVYMYVPRHDRSCFVDKVDFISAPGVDEGANLKLIITDLAVLGFGVDGAMEVKSLMPGATREQLKDRTSFDLRFPDTLEDFVGLTPHQLKVLRQDIDPHSLRDLELYSGEQRLAHIEALARNEPAQDILHAKFASLLNDAGC